MEDLGCDHDSVSYFERLVRLPEPQPEGYMEAWRILQHFVMDKDTSLPPRRSSVLNSRCLRNACLEALDALANPQDCEQGPEHNAKGAYKGGRASDPGGKGKGKDFGSSSSS